MKQCTVFIKALFTFFILVTASVNSFAENPRTTYVKRLLNDVEAAPINRTDQVKQGEILGEGKSLPSDYWSKNRPDSDTIKNDAYVDLSSPARRTHILDGDSTGGGHRAGTGKPNKSEFPQDWSDDKIMHEISDVATDPNAKRIVRGERSIVEGRREEVNLRVVQEKNGEIVTGFPTNLQRNPEK